MSRNVLYIAVMALVFLYNPRPSADADPQTDPQHIYPVVSFYYVPYVTLAVMTFPAILHATQSPISGAVALIAGIIAAWLGAGLFPVSVICCALVFLIELFI